MDSDVKDLSLAETGRENVEWAERDMPVLRTICGRFARERPLEGLRLSCCLHVTTETANLMRTLQAGGAELVLCASNPLSTQDDVAAALAKEYDVRVYARKGEDRETYYGHIRAALEHRPHITMDDGADLVSTLHSEYAERCGEVAASMEETTTGVIRLRAMERDGELKIPVVAVNDADTKRLFDNRYGTGQSTVEGIIRATGMLMAGKKVVVCGYGMCGRGFAMRARGMGAHVIVAEVNPLRALEAVMDGYEVTSLAEAAPRGELFCTLTGDVAVLRKEHFERMKDGAVVANSGHFNVEIAIDELRSLAEEVRRVRPYVEEFVLKGGRRIYLLAEGRLVNLAAAEGHPACVMDMSFALQALCAEWAAKNRGRLGIRVHDVPREIDGKIARLKLAEMGITIDTLTQEQEEYLKSWKLGT